jgi:glycosyltransferase involved in cell wall biosynthesis
VKRLLTIGHSYVVAQNRRLAHEMALAGGDEWSVTVAAPRRYRGDLRVIDLEASPGEACRLVPVTARLDGVPHAMFYGGLGALLREPWDVVHCWEEPYVLAGAQIAGRAPRNATFVFSTFQNIAKRYPPPFSLFERRVLRRASGWIAFGETVHTVQQSRMPAYRSLPSAVIPPGVDQSAFRADPRLRADARARLGWSGEIPVIGFVGRFVAQKGVDTLLEALSGLRAPWRALFVGGGPGQPAIDAFAKLHDVRVVSDAAHDDVPRWMNAMDVLCAPSRSTPAWREQFGRMLVEAMACEVAVLASNSGEIPHVVGDAGIVLPERDVRAWREAIESLLVDPDARRARGSSGVARVRDRYAWPVVAGRHLAFFDSCRP